MIGKYILKSSYQPSRRETLLSLLILTGLALIAAAVYHRQAHFNPAVSVATTASSYFQQPVASDAGNAGNGWSGYLPEMIALTPPEVFHADNLSDKINGKAELYLPSGFRGLKSQRFRLADSADSWFEIFVYDMGNVAGAFSVYSRQRREDAVSAGIGRFSYQTPNALFFLHGPFYVEIIGSVESEPLLTQMRAFSQNFIQSIPAGAEKLKELELFPAEHLDPASLTLIAEGGFGYDRLNHVFTADYTHGDIKMTAFLSRRKSPEEAQGLVRGYHDFLSAYGGNDLQTTLPLTDVRVVDILGSYELFFTRGAFLAGVHEAADRGAAEQLALQLDHKLREATDDRR